MRTTTSATRNGNGHILLHMDEAEKALCDVDAGCCASPANSGFSAGLLQRQCMQNRHMERSYGAALKAAALVRLRLLMLRVRGWVRVQIPTVCSSAAARRMWPLWKSSSAEYVAAADGDGKRKEKLKSMSRAPGMLFLPWVQQKKNANLPLSDLALCYYVIPSL